VGGLPPTRRRSIWDSRNLSRPSVTVGQPLPAKMHGSCTREDGLDRTRPSRGSAAVGSGGGVGEFHPDGGRAGKAPGEVRNGEQDQAPRAAFLIAADSNSQRQAAATNDDR
jgi:hypothetical protein